MGSEGLKHAHFRIGGLVLIALMGAAAYGIRGVTALTAPEVTVDRECAEAARARASSCVRRCRGSDAIKVCIEECTGGRGSAPVPAHPG
jgi:hypothetical protein